MDKYSQDLRAAAAHSLKRPWPSCWPRWTREDLQIHHSQTGAMSCAAELIEQAEIDRQSEDQVVCVIEDITAEWAIELGAAWNIPVRFFIEYLDSPEFEDGQQLFEKMRLPGSSGGLCSSRGEDSWVTMRGIVDYGERHDESSRQEQEEYFFRRRWYTRNGNFMQHTNVSMYKVHEKLDLFLVDSMSSAHPTYSLGEEPTSPGETIVRLAFVDWPGYISYPRLLESHETATLPLWTLMEDRRTAESLTQCLNDHGIDDFFNKAAVYASQSHLNASHEEIRFVSLQNIPDGEETIMAQLRDARQALNRLYRCVESNKSLERAFNRSIRSKEQTKNHCDRTLFHELAKEVQELDQAVLRDMNVLMMTMSGRDISNNLALTEATHRQSRSVTVLTWVMMTYAPLSFAAGIFGMNLRQLNGTGSTLDINWFLIVAFALLGITLLLAFTCHYIDKAIQTRGYTVGELLQWRRIIESMKKMCALTIGRLPRARWPPHRRTPTESTHRDVEAQADKLETGEAL